MKRPLIVALGLPLLFAATANACEADAAAMMSQITKASAPSNVKAMALKQKAAQCEQNARNFGLQGGQRTIYVDTCVNQNDAAALRAGHV